MNVVAATIPKGIASLLVHLVWRESQRAEYLADAFARRVAGSEATASMLMKLYLGDDLREVVQRRVLEIRTAEGILVESASGCVVAKGRNKPE